MLPLDGDEPLEFRSNRSSKGCLPYLAGLLTFLILSIGLRRQLQGDSLLWFLLLAVPLGLWFLSRKMRHETSKIEMLIEQDRIVLSPGAKREKIINWDDVEAVDWPESADDDSTIRFKLKNADSDAPKEERIDLSSLYGFKFLTLICCVRIACKHAGQIGWPGFCQRMALPLSRRGLSKSPSVIDHWGVRDTLFYKMHMLTQSLTKKYPFFMGFLLIPLTVVGPLIALFIQLEMISRFLPRRIWWKISLLLVLSCAINMFLIWGQWVSPIAEFVLANAALSFLLGVTAKSTAIVPFRNIQVKLPPVTKKLFDIWLGLAVVGIPLLFNAMTKNWVPDIKLQSEIIRKIFLGLFMGFVLAPVIYWFVFLFKALHEADKQREENADLSPKAPTPEDMEEWDAFEANFLPSAKLLEEKCEA